MIKATLKPYQRKAIATILKKKRVGLFLGMSLGKTLCVLTAIDYLYKNNHIKKVLIIAPLRVANNVWSDEIVKWQHLKHLQYSIITGDIEKREKALKSDALIHIINRENMDWLGKKIKYDNYDFIVVDESSSFKNHASKRFSVLKKFKSNYMILLSGTPTPNGMEDLWSQIFLLDRGEALGKCITHYRNEFFTYDIYTRQYSITKQKIELIYKRIEHLVLSLKTEDYLDIPEKIYSNIIVKLDSMEQYNQFRDTCLLKLKDGSIIDASTKLVLSNKLLQYCNGFVYDEEKNCKHIHYAKIKALEEELEHGENVMVAYSFKEDLKMLQQFFPHGKLLDKDGTNIKKWNKGEIPLLFVHPKSCGHGLNLQFGGRILIWYGLTWDLDCYLQMNARLHRMGQDKPVLIKHIILKNAEDENVMRALNLKDVDLNNLLNRFALRDL